MNTRPWFRRMTIALAILAALTVAHAAAAKPSDREPTATIQNIINNIR